MILSTWLRLGVVSVIITVANRPCVQASSLRDVSSQPALKERLLESMASESVGVGQGLLAPILLSDLYQKSNPKIAYQYLLVAQSKISDFNLGGEALLRRMGKIKFEMGLFEESAELFERLLRTKDQVGQARRESLGYLIGAYFSTGRFHRIREVYLEQQLKGYLWHLLRPADLRMLSEALKKLGDRNYFRILETIASAYYHNNHGRKAFRQNSVGYGCHHHRPSARSPHAAKEIR